MERGGDGEMGGWGETRIILLVLPVPSPQSPFPISTSAIIHPSYFVKQGVGVTTIGI
jgi:hypothetical protein